MSDGSMPMLAGWRLVTGDPLARLVGAGKREEAHIAGHEKAEDLHRITDPVNVGDEGDPLPVSDMLHADLEVLPHGARTNALEVTVKLMVEAPDTV